MNAYKTEAEIEKVVSDFEACRTPKDAFHHAQHLVVAVCYLQQLSTEHATARMRESLMRFLDHHQVDKQKYNETLTAFWVQMVASVLGELPKKASLVEKCNQTIESLNDPKLALKFYSEELLWSDEARKHYVAPDET